MTETFSMILGLPGSGKTTFLAALWHLIDASEVETKLVLDRLVGDHVHLNRITEAWRRCEEVPRTSIAAETDVSMHVHNPADGTKAVLEFPDLSGESFENQFIGRSCSNQYVESTGRADGMLLFVTANRKADGMTIVDLAPLIAGEEAENDAATEAEAGGETKGEQETEWNHRMVPEQVQLVDLLQFIQSPPFARRRRRIVVAISAWDVVPEPKPNPEKWLARELPLLDQYLRHNPESFDLRVYGVSAQGGDVAGPNRMQLASMTPSARIQCVYEDQSGHDLTDPLVWLTASD
ncbi:hypothetical protein GCM10007989_14150 [Devosia pacifica]|uniref:Double-GTPase 1 domain-containing protein n=1 Tax=Devosia pacifica TaxID=1335967 RepID=A0A918S1V3_9HYPH|nr:hypothetical protein [Devosia pacifica]GHA19713.1 hypothetical protein GCM10007989_14150 [Devosia pacifica]